jgi:protein-L-isoaspartate(D-aspartate) O-methyltransferase
MSTDPRTIRLLMELRQQGISDLDVLGAIESTPSDLFAPEAFADQAHTGPAVPTTQGREVGQPMIVALMCEALALGPRLTVLEVGAGAGYTAAVLARLCRRLYTIERRRSGIREAENRFAQIGLRNVVTRVGDGNKGWPEAAPFDRILVTTAVPNLAALIEQLKPNGIMVALGPGAKALVRFRRQGGQVIEETLWPARREPLQHGTSCSG